MKKYNEYTSEENLQAKLFWALVLFWPLGVYLTIRQRPQTFRRTYFIVILVLYAYLTSYFAVSVMMYPSEQTEAARQWQHTVAMEESRNYSIDVDGLDDDASIITYECNLQKQTADTSSNKYESQSAAFQCADQIINGKYHHYDTTYAISSGFGGDLHSDGDTFKLTLQLDRFTKKDWEKGSLDFSSLQKNGVDKLVRLSIKNKALDSAVMSEKIIKIHYLFTDADIALLKQQNDRYNNYVKAETERKAKERAEKAAAKAQAEAEKAAKERAEKQAAQQKAQSQQQSSTSSGSSSGNTSPNSGVTNTVSGYCNDGTYVTGNPSARGRANACYGHKGWRDY